jgi:hypothetical protein
MTPEEYTGALNALLIRRGRVVDARLAPGANGTQQLQVLAAADEGNDRISARLWYDLSDLLRQASPFQPWPPVVVSPMHCLRPCRGHVGFQRIALERYRGGEQLQGILETDWDGNQSLLHEVALRLFTLCWNPLSVSQEELPDWQEELRLGIMLAYAEAMFHALLEPGSVSVQPPHHLEITGTDSTGANVRLKIGGHYQEERHGQQVWYPSYLELTLLNEHRVPYHRVPRIGLADPAFRGLRDEIERLLPTLYMRALTRRRARSASGATRG